MDTVSVFRGWFFKQAFYGKQIMALGRDTQDFLQAAKEACRTNGVKNLVFASGVGFLAEVVLAPVADLTQIFGVAFGLTAGLLTGVDIGKELERQKWERSRLSKPVNQPPSAKDNHTPQP
jgi:hypothetical protein